MAGNARQVVNFFKGNGLNLNCICVLTNEHKKFFQPVAGETLIAADEFPTLPVKPKYIFVTDNFFGAAFMDYFKRFGTKMFFQLDVNAAEAQYNLYMKHLPELYDVHEMFADAESKKVFRAAITGSVTKIMQDFRFAAEPQYFLNGFLPEAGDIAIDGGSYNGGTSADFARQGAQVYAFEMDANNYKNCIAPAEKFGFTIENLGLSNQIGDASYLRGGAGSYKLADGVGGELLAHFIDLDSYVERKNLPRVDYIKLDIEGSELDALHGAAKSISRWKPKMAICVYHKPEDLWTLPKYIKSLCSSYEFQMRHHSIDRRKSANSNNHWATLKYFGLSYFCPSYCETVLYCK